MSLHYLMLLTKEVFDVLKMRKIKRKSLNKFQQRKELKEKPLEVFDHSEIIRIYEHWVALESENYQRIGLTV